MTDTFKVRLEPRNRSDGPTVVFHASPEITETRTINYKVTEPVHMPGAFQAYNNSSARTYSVSNIKIFSRTPEEASVNLARINTLRGWTVSKFGRGSGGGLYAVTDVPNTAGENDYGKTNEQKLDQEYKYYGQNNRTYSSNTAGGSLTDDVKIGLPPAVLELSAYSNAKHRGNIYRIPVVITSLSIPYPTDVDYIPTTEGTPFPIIMTISIELTEAHSPINFENFDIIRYRRGELLTF